MTRLGFVALLIAVTVSPTAFAQQKKQKPLDPFNFEVGQIGAFIRADNEALVLKVSTIIGKDEMLVRCHHSKNNDSPDFILRGKSTDGFADDKTFFLIDGVWKVTKTEKRGTKTLYVVEPYKEGK